MINVSIIIPYFQREPGLLRRALDSIFAQSLADNVAVEIIIADDESPSPPEIEISNLARANFSITTLKQRNGGPARARNNGLDHAAEADYVAFLDSDDYWLPNHLSTALAALKDGAGFYFANNIPDPGTTWFKQLRNGDELIARAEPRAGAWRRISSDALLPLFLDDCVAHTSSVVIDMAVIRDKRFDESQAKAGEDYLFWLEAVTHTPFAALCVEPQAVRGHGVDLDRSAYDWNNPGSVRRLYYNLLFRKKARERYCTTKEHRQIVTKLLRKLRREILYLLMRNALVYKSTNSWVLARLAEKDPAFFLLLPINLSVIIWQRATNRLDFVNQ